jgi:hypothetical protein
MATSFFCSECLVNWWPYQAKDGCCPRCGGGTRLRQEPASDDAEPLFVIARVEAAHRERCDAFEAYYAEREQRRAA